MATPTGLAGHMSLFSRLSVKRDRLVRMAVLLLENADQEDGVCDIMGGCMIEEGPDLLG